MNPATTIIHSAMKLATTASLTNSTFIPNVSLTTEEANVLYATCAICSSSALSIIVFVAIRIVRSCRQSRKKVHPTLQPEETSEPVLPV
jgi:hypothetical protein